MTLLAEVVRASARVAENPSRLATIRELAESLRRRGWLDTVRRIYEHQSKG